MKEKKTISQDRMLSIPNYYRRNANQNDNEKSNIIMHCSRGSSWNDHVATIYWSRD